MLSSFRFILALFLIAGGPVLAQNIKPPGMSESEAAARRFPQPVRVGNLIGRTVLQPLESQPVLGRVESLVRRPDGTVAVVVRYGGLLGIGARPIAVPLDAMVSLGEYMEIVDLKPAELDRLPTFDGSGVTAIEAAQVVKVGLARPSH